MKKNISLIAGTLIITSFIHFKNSQSAENPFENFRTEIREKYIQVPTEGVLQAIKDERSIAEKFEEYLDKDDRVNKIIEIRKDGTTADGLKATEMVRNVIKDFATKQNGLFSNYTWATRFQTISGALFLPAAAASIYCFPQRNNSEIAYGATIAALLSPCFCWYLSKQRSKIQIHLDEVSKMMAEWHHRFKKEKKPQEMLIQ